MSDTESLARISEWLYRMFAQLAAARQKHERRVAKCHNRHWLPDDDRDPARLHPGLRPTE